MPYTTDALIWLTYAHFMIFLVPAMGLGIALLREDSLHSRNANKDATIHNVTFGKGRKGRAA